MITKIKNISNKTVLIRALRKAEPRHVVGRMITAGVTEDLSPLYTQQALAAAQSEITKLIAKGWIISA